MSGAANAGSGAPSGTAGAGGGGQASAGNPGAVGGGAAPQTAPAIGGNGGGVPSGASAPTGGASSDWTLGMNDVHKSYVQQKGFKDSVAVLDSYINMEKLMGVPQDRLLKLPSKEDDPAWSEVHDKLGRPRDPKEYNFNLPKGSDENFANWARNTFHELGFSKSAGEKLVAKWGEFAQAAQNSKVQAQNERVAQEEGALKKEWGAAFDKHVSMAKHAAGAFGIDGPTLDRLESALGYAGTLKLLHGMGAKIGESRFVGGDQSGSNFSGVMTPAAARGRIQSLRNDSDFVRRFTSGESAAKEEMTKLHQMAYPD